MVGAGKMSWCLWQNYTIKFIANKKSDSLVHGIQWHISSYPVCSVIPGHCHCPVHRDPSGGCQRRGAGHLRVVHSQLFHHLLSGKWEGNVTDFRGGFAWGCWMIFGSTEPWLWALPSVPSPHSSSCSEPKGAWAMRHLTAHPCWVP